MMGGDDDDGDTIVETQEISSENLFHAPPPLSPLASQPAFPFQNFYSILLLLLSPERTFEKRGKI